MLINLVNYLDSCTHYIYYITLQQGSGASIILLPSIYFNAYKLKHRHLKDCHIPRRGAQDYLVRRLNSNAANWDRQTVTLQGQKYG